MTRGRTAFASWLLTVGFSYAYLSEFLGYRIEGRLAAQDEIGLAVLVLVSAGVSIVLTVRWAGAPRASSEGEGLPLARRRFLLALLGTGGGLAATLAAAIVPNRRWGSVTIKNIFAVRPPYMADVARDEWGGSRVTGYRRLGRTEAFVSDISMGSGSSAWLPPGSATAQKSHSQQPGIRSQ